MALTDVISRSFSCGDPAIADRAPLTNAQTYMLRAIDALVGVNTINVTLRVNLPATTTVDFVASRVQTMVETYSAFRTIFPRDEHGFHFQQLVQAAEFQISILSADDRSVDEVVSDCFASFLSQPFQLENDLPFRCGVITKEGKPVVLAMVFSHLILDRWSLRLVREELESYFVDNDVVSAPRVQNWSPIDQGKYEQSETVKDRLEARLKYWRETLSLFPSEMLQFGTDRPSSPGQWINITIQSSALHRALAVLGNKHAMPTGTILLSVFAAALGRYFSIDLLAAEIMFSNRVDRTTQSAIGQYAQPTPVAMDLGKRDFHTLLTQLQARLLRAYDNASVPPAEIDTILGSISAKRVGTCFNIDHSADSGELQNANAHELLAALQDAKKESAIRDTSQWDYDWSRIYVESHSPRYILMRVDSRLIPVENVHKMLNSIEAVVIELATDGSSSFWPVIERLCPAGNECHQI